MRGEQQRHALKGGSWRLLAAIGGATVAIVCVVALGLVVRGTSLAPTGFAAIAPSATPVPLINNAVGYYNRANTLQATHRCDQAISLYLQAVQDNPMYVAAYRALGACYQSSEVGSFDKAITYYNKALQIDPSNYGIYYDRAGAELNNGNTGQAIADTWQALRFAPVQPPAYISIAQRFDSLTDLADEVVAIQKAIDAAPGNAAYYVAQANVYVKVGDLARAVADYYRAIHAAPYAVLRATTYADLADVYSGQQDYADAYAASAAAIAVQPGNADLYRRSGDIHQASGDFAAALTLYRRTLQGHAHGAVAESAYASEGATYVKLNDAGKALSAYRQAVQLVVTNEQRTKLSNELADLADFYTAVPNNVVAFQFSALSTVVSPGDVQLLLRSAVVHRQARDLRSALSLDNRALQRALALSDQESAYEDRGDTYYTMGRLGKAAADYIQAQRLTTDDSTLNRLGSKLKAAGR